MTTNPIPCILYKYINNVDCLDSILGGNLKFTPRSELMDKMELRPSFSVEDVRGSIERYRRNGFTAQDLHDFESQPALVARIFPGNTTFGIFQGFSNQINVEDLNSLFKMIPAESFIDTLRQKYTELQNALAEKIGVLCLSESMDSPSMWAHYADNHRGCVVEYTDIASEFQGDATRVLDVPLRVKYSDLRASITLEILSHVAMFTNKVTEWAVEREIRILRPLVECEPVMVGSEGSKCRIYVHQCDPSRVTRIILGAGILNDKRDEACDLASKMKTRVAIDQMTIDSGTGEFAPRNLRSP